MLARRDFYWPFCQKFGKRIGKINSAWHSFVGPIPNEVGVRHWNEEGAGADEATVLSDVAGDAATAQPRLCAALV